ncbi:MAG TPA: hypothetical protein VFH31_05395 [Pyrinomonadaceae bacterium]|nr:hypothetical protein [Pyrinomonadaceae bacterium]
MKELIAQGPVDVNVMPHTPGPWHWEADAVKGDPYDRVRYQVTALGKTVTRVYYSSYEGGPTNAEADARLIAAAPELLAALIEMEREKADYMRLNNLGDPARETTNKMARAAIAKAIGHNVKFSGEDKRSLTDSAGT